MSALVHQTRFQWCVRAVFLRLSRMGERLGISWLTYNPAVYWHFHWMAVYDAPRMAHAVLAEFPAATSLADVGCGTGAFAAEFARRGLRVGACEYAARGRRWARRAGIDAIPFDVSREQPSIPGAPFDIAMSLEVGEHIPPPLADTFVDFVASTGRDVVLTAAHPGQGGQGHVNEQPQSYWIQKFEQRGLRHDAAASARIAASLRGSDASDWLFQNMMIFRRT
jgi:SAM-dependent methyltransferase